MPATRCARGPSLGAATLAEGTEQKRRFPRLASPPRRQGTSAFKSRRLGNRIPPNCVERARPERRSPTGIDRREAVETAHRRLLSRDAGKGTPTSGRHRPAQRGEPRTAARAKARGRLGTPTSGQSPGVGRHAWEIGEGAGNHDSDKPLYFKSRNLRSNSFLSFRNSVSNCSLLTASTGS